MKRIPLYALLMCLVFAVIYTLSADKISKYLSSRYDVEINKGREKIGLIPITDDWQLDSTKYDDFFDSYIQFWSPLIKDTTNPYVKNKQIFFNKSFWLWNNYIIGEIDYYINPINKYEFIELYILYDYSGKEWAIAIDTLETDYKIQKDKLEIEKVMAENNFFVCGGLTELDMPTELTKSNANKILKSWNLK